MRLFVAILVLVYNLDIVQGDNSTIITPDALAFALTAAGANSTEIEIFQCIVNFVSKYDYSTKKQNGRCPNGATAFKYGLYQISSRVWCDTCGLNGCNMICDDLMNSNIMDDAWCAMTILNQQPNFAAWSYPYEKCKGTNNQ